MAKTPVVEKFLQAIESAMIPGKPLAGTELCEAPHFQYHVQGTLHVVMSDGAEFDARPGDITRAAPGAWRLGGRGRAGRHRRLVRGQQLRAPLTARRAGRQRAIRSAFRAGPAGRRL